MDKVHLAASGTTRTSAEGSCSSGSLEAGRTSVEAGVSVPQGEETGVTVYLCGTDHRHHLTEDTHGTRVFPSVEDLKAHSSCWPQCGIVAVKVSAPDWIVHGDYKAAPAPSAAPETAKAPPEVLPNLGAAR